MFVSSIDDLSAAGRVLVFTVDFNARSCVEDTITAPFGQGGVVALQQQWRRRSWARNTRLNGN
ncbi:MAG: hypothetical protein GY926_12155 [bacterium]|nr:hypothetical protein [bacterium]